MEMPSRFLVRQKERGRQRENGRSRVVSGRRMKRKERERKGWRDSLWVTWRTEL